MADLYQHEINRGLRYINECIVKPTPTMRFVDEPGAADLFVAKGGRSVMIEVKTGKGGPGATTKSGEKKSDAGHGFPFDEWRENQREWAVKYCRSVPYSTEYWLAIFIGLDTPNVKEWITTKATKSNPSQTIPNINPATGKMRQPRRCWLVPHDVWMGIEALVRPIQGTLPYRIEKGYDLEMQEYKYDAVNLLARWELTRTTVKNQGAVYVPNSHPFHGMYLDPAPLPLFTLGEANQCQPHQLSSPSTANYSPNPAN